MNYYGFKVRVFYFTIVAVLSNILLTSPVQAESTRTEKGASSDAYSPPLNAEGDYNLTFHNGSNYQPVTVTRTKQHCMQKDGLGPDSLTIPPGESRSFGIKDSNNILTDCTNAEKKLEWEISYDKNGYTGNLSFNHYDCPKGTGTSGLCVVGEVLKGWRTKIEYDKKNVDLVNNATCDGNDCLNKAVNDNNKVPAIAITLMDTFQARPLVISRPAPMKYPAGYSFSPGGTASPGAVISLKLTGCPSGRAEDCNIPDVVTGVDGSWSLPSRTLMASPGYTLTASQNYLGYNGPNNPQVRAFTVFDNRVNTKIISPPNSSWLPAGNGVTVEGTVEPRSDSSKIRCYMDGKDTGIASSEVYGSGSWQCIYPPPTPGLHRFSGRVEPEHSEDQDETVTYITATPLAVTSPADNAMLYPPIQFSGTQQPGGVVSYTSDHCGSGQAVSTGDTWTAQPLRSSDTCKFAFTQRWQGMTSPEVRRTIFLKKKPVLTSASVVEQDTQYPLAGTGEPGATLDLSLSDGWFPIDSVTVGADGNWVSKPGPMSGSGDYTLSLKQSLEGLPDVTSEITLTVEDENTTPENTGAKK